MNKSTIHPFNRKRYGAAAEIRTDTFNGLWDKIKIGDRIGAIDGPGQGARNPQRMGNVVEKSESAWGRRLRIRMANGRFESVSGLTKVGIGFYAVEFCDECGERIDKTKAGEFYLGYCEDCYEAAGWYNAYQDGEAALEPTSDPSVQVIPEKYRTLVKRWIEGD